MTIERGLRLAAGIVVLLSVSLAVWVSPYWLALTAFAGAEFAAIGFHELVPYGMVTGAIGIAALRVAGQRATVAQPSWL